MSTGSRHILQSQFRRFRFGWGPVGVESGCQAGAKGLETNVSQQACAFYVVSDCACFLASNETGVRTYPFMVIVPPYYAKTESAVVSEEYYAETESAVVSEEYYAETESAVVSEEYYAETEPAVVSEEYYAETEPAAVSEDESKTPSYELRCLRRIGLVSFLVFFFLYKTNPNPRKTYLLWKKTAQIPLLA